MEPFRFIAIQMGKKSIQQQITRILFTNQTTTKRLEPNLPCVISVGIMRGN